MNPDPSNSVPRERVCRRRLSVVVALCTVAFIWIGCTVTDDNYAFLATFFDGVPDPALIRAAQEENAVVRGEVVYYQHKPYAEEACDDCHRGASDVMLFTTRTDSSMCLKCHEGVPTQHPYMHGPVASTACLWCHRPHQSTIRPLLRAASPELCIQCHGLDMMNAPQPPEHVDLKQDCLECHFAHGGKDPYFMRRAGEGPDEGDGAGESDVLEGGIDAEKTDLDSGTSPRIGEEGSDTGAP